MDPAIAEGLEDTRKGHVYSPFETVDEMLASMKGRKQTAKVKKTAHVR